MSSRHPVQFREPVARLSVTPTTTGPVTVLAVAGELTFGTAHQLGEAVDRVLRDPAALRIVLDLSGVVFFCSAGLHALLDVRQATGSAACHLILHGAPERVRRVLGITGDDRFFEFRDTDPP
jgi:anti-sigma B factor antagonist